MYDNQTLRDWECCRCDSARIVPQSLSAWEVCHHWSVVLQGCSPSLSVCYKSGREIAAGTSLPFSLCFPLPGSLEGIEALRTQHKSSLPSLPCDYFLLLHPPPPLQACT